MAIKHKIKFKKQVEEKKEDLHERDRPRYEEQSEEEYLRHCERFFKGWDDEKWNKRFKYPKSVRSNVDGKRIYEVGNEKLPSVTTILGQTQSIEKRESLAKWIAKKGKNEANRVKNEAAARGSAMHSIIEHHVNGNNILDHDRDGSGSASNGCCGHRQGF